MNRNEEVRCIKEAKIRSEKERKKGEDHGCIEEVISLVQVNLNEASRCREGPTCHLLDL